jgi:hypothetical protein
MSSPSVRRYTAAELRAFDTRRDVAVALAKIIGVERLGHNCTWLVGSQRLTVCIQVDGRTGRWVVTVIEGWPESGRPRKTLALHEAYAAFATGKLTRPVGPERERTKAKWDSLEAALFKLRFLERAGSVERPNLSFPAIPATAPESARKVWQHIHYLLRLRQLGDFFPPEFPLSGWWLADIWSRGGRALLTESEAINGRRWLEAHGYLRRVGNRPSRGGGRPTILWVAVDPATGVLVG